MDIRSRELVRAAAIVVLGVAACVYLVFVTKVGPVILTISAGHGVHLGDLLVFPIIVLTLVLAAVAARNN